MAKLSNFSRRSTTLEVFPEEPGLLTVDYRPSQFHEDLMAELEAIHDKPDATTLEKLQANVLWIRTMVSGWNVEAEESTEKNPVYLPVSDEHIKALGLVYQSAIIRAITADLKMGE